MMKSLSKVLILALVVCLGLSACGKKPKHLTCSECSEDYPRSYPSY